MGICTSRDAMLAALPTAKVILPDGTLQEYAGTVRASQVLLQKGLDSHFVCSADGMEFGERISSVGSDEALVPGEIYFALPASARRRRLAPEEMAALAVRASAALVRSGDGVGVHGEACGRKRAAVSPAESAAGEGKGGRRNCGKGERRRRRCSFVPDLSAIPEY